jgi:transcriptional repressor of cell division inhibition gene dicB
MTTDEAVKHYGTQTKLAAALGIRQPTISGWGDFPPPLRQLQLQQLTKGKLKAEPGLLAVKAA